MRIGDSVTIRDLNEEIVVGQITDIYINDLFETQVVVNNIFIRYPVEILTLDNLLEEAGKKTQTYWYLKDGFLFEKVPSHYARCQEAAARDYLQRILKS
jgi:hypothetical protein